GGDRAAERAGHALAERDRRRNLEAPLAQPSLPGERRRPTILRRRSHRPGVRAGASLAPPPFVAEPCEGALRGDRPGREERRLQSVAVRRPACVFTAPAFACAVPEPERARIVVGVGAGRHVDERMGPGALELRAVPARALTALVLCVCDLERPAPQGLTYGVRCERELDALPVALMLVVEVVEVVVEPVLQGDAVPNPGLAREGGVGEGRGRAEDGARRPLVAATGVGGVAGVVEVVVAALSVEIPAGGRAQHSGRADEPHGRIAEDAVDGD